MTYGACGGELSGPGKAPSIEAALINHVKSLPYSDPVANQTHYVVLLDTAQVRTAGVTSSPAAVLRWQNEALEKVPPAQRAAASFQVMPFANRSAAEEFASRWLRGP